MFLASFRYPVYANYLTCYQRFFKIIRLSNLSILSVPDECYSRNDNDDVILYVICASLHIVVSNTYFVMFLFCFSAACVPYVASFSGLSIFECPSGIF